MIVLINFPSDWTLGPAMHTTYHYTVYIHHSKNIPYYILRMRSWALRERRRVYDYRLLSGA